MTGSGKTRHVCTWKYFEKYHFKIFNYLKQPTVYSCPSCISSNKLLDFIYVVNLVNGRWLDFRAFETIFLVCTNFRPTNEGADGWDGGEGHVVAQKDLTCCLEQE